ncbi:MAG: OmpA family protein [Myxococcota bacterium]
MRATLCLLLFLVPLAARAQDALSLEVRDRALEGGPPNALILRVHEPLRRVSLEGATGRIGLRTGLSSGDEVEFRLPAPRPGRHRFEGVLKVVFPDGRSAERRLAFDYQLVAPLSYDVDATPDSVAAGRLQVRAEGRALERFEMVLFGAGQRELARLEGPMPAEGRLRWAPPDDKVYRIQLVVHAADGAFREVALHPWKLDVPHEEVLFETGSADIRESEVPKLQASLQAIRKALDEVRPWADAQLFIAGHTDTVGEASANARLSGRRSLAIGRWFQAHGLTVSVWTVGVGEASLAVPTADEVEEARNRRVEYIIAVDRPGLPASFAWRRLRGG